MEITWQRPLVRFLSAFANVGETLALYSIPAYLTLGAAENDNWTMDAKASAKPETPDVGSVEGYEVVLATGFR